MRHPLKHWVEYILLRGLGGFLNLLPYRAALGVGWFLALLSFWIPSKRRMADRRLKQVFGDSMSARRRRHVAWIAWRNLIFVAIEAMRVPKLTLEWAKKVWDYQEIEKVIRITEGGHGLVLAVPHMGNWEWGGVTAQMITGKMMTIARRQKNLLVDAHLNRMRDYFGFEAVPRESKSFAGVVRRLQDGKVLAIPIDLLAKGASVRVRYLGCETTVPAGPAYFARQANVPLMPAVIVRVGWARHRWTVHEPIMPDPSLDATADIQRMTQQVMDIIDRAVREQPEQYFWFNKRWVLGEEATSKQ